MKDGTHHKGHRRHFYRRAVSPNLFTCTLHPEFIPSLVVANLMTPCLWEWAEQSVAGVGVTKPHAALDAIHKFLNKRFHHATGQEFAETWGLQERRHLPDEDERKASDYAMSLIAESLIHVGDQHPWTLPLIPLLKDGLFPLYAYGTADLLRVNGRRMGKRTYGVTSCLDECTLAAALAIATGVCKWEDIVFLGSPLHYTVFFFTSEGGVWFNAKREIFHHAAWREHCEGQSHKDRAGHIVDKLIIADRLICGEGLVVYPQKLVAGRHEAVAAAVAAVEDFANTRLEWLHPLPESGLKDTYEGWDALEGRSAEEVERNVLERVAQGPVPLMEAALYMFRHPEFCEGEVLLEAGRRNFYAYLRSAMADSVTDVAAMVDSIKGRESLYGPTGRMALPEEVLAFGTASDAERELLRRVLQEHVDERG